MNNILVIGAGRSSTALINYLLDRSDKFNWQITVADASAELAKSKIKGHPNGKALQLDVMISKKRRGAINKADIVVSLLPASLHIHVLRDCIKYKKHIVTASYVSEETYELDPAAREADIIMMGEMGLDPGIDHMSAMQKINRIKADGGKMYSMKSYGGGLIAPESDDNPWHYKFTWNPRNVVLAGRGTAQYMEDGKYKYIPYNRVFSRIEKVEVPGIGHLEAYANRDSLFYKEIYKISHIPNILRGTLRYPGYCQAWNAFVKLGLTDDTYPVLESDDITYRELIEAYLDTHGYESEDARFTKKHLADFLDEEENSEVMQKLEWLGIFENRKVGLKKATPAQILQQLLEEKWELKSDDKDMVIMQHQFDYKIKDKKKRLISTMVLKGDDQVNTAMAKLVGLPMGIFVKLILQGKIKARGVHIPIMSSVYNPILEELEELGVQFHEKEINLK